MTGDRKLGPEGGAYEIAPLPLLAKELPSGSLLRRTYELLTVDQILDRKLPPWILRRVVRQGELLVVFGPPACGKTFLVLDIVLSVAMGFDWRGYSTKPGAIVYFAGEGVGGLGMRILAWAMEHGVDARSLDVRVLPHAIAFLEEDEFQQLLRSVAELDPKPLVIVVDTLARYMVGADENSAQDMGQFVDRCAHLVRVTGATVIVVHHSSKGARVERGSSALRGAADVLIRVEKKDGTIEVVGDKAKDAEMLPSLLLELKSIYLGVDEDGEVITSCVLVDSSATEVVQKGAPAAKFEPEAEPVSTIEENGASIVKTLKTVLAGRSAGGTLRDACGGSMGKTAYYDALEAEIEAGRIVTIGGRFPTYALPESASPSPAPDSIPDSDSIESGDRVRESESATPPLGGGAADSNSDSTRRAAKKPQQDKKGKGGKP